MPPVEAFWAAFFASLPATIAAIGAVVLAYNNRMIAAESKAKLEDVHRATNSMHDALVKKTEEEAFARGHREGTAEERTRTGAGP